ncbi:MAG: HEPN domain-containing protein [Armatimonadetes bacterium]|nr:HEPN domain-containing protein [Armatimonadota bacterium]
MPERSKDWLLQSERDLEEAKWSFQGEFYEWTCFIAQQAAEKGVKALYQAINAEAWGHSISKLLKELPPEFSPDGILIEKSLHLDKFYLQPRYPNGFDIGSPKDYFTKNDAEGAIKNAAEIIEWCKSKICK